MILKLNIGAMVKRCCKNGINDEKLTEFYVNFLSIQKLSPFFPAMHCRDPTKY